jgi:hypothetical protein
VSAAPKVSTMVHAIELVVAAHRAKLSEASLMTAEKIARDVGATREQLQRAVARGVQATLLIGAAVLAGCQPADAAAVTPAADSVYAIGAGVRIPGRLLAKRAGVETWDMGDFTVRVRRVQP